jgi:hypothetical protein
MLADHFYRGDPSFDPKEIPSDKEVKTKDQLNVPLPADNLSLHALAVNLSKTLPREPALPSDRQKARAWVEDRRRALRSLVRVKQYEAREQTSNEEVNDGLKATYWRLRVGDWAVPVVELSREGQALKTSVLLLADKGRKEAAPRARAMLDAGHRVFAVDPFYVGESRVIEKDYLFALLLAAIGDRPLGLQATEIAAVARWAKAERKSGPVSVVADGPRTSVMALVATALEPEAIAGLEVRGSYGSLKEVIEASKLYNDAPELFCFGLLEQLDIAQLAALAAPRPVTLVEPGERARSELSGIAAWYQVWGSKHQPFGSQSHKSP